MKKIIICFSLLVCACASPKYQSELTKDISSFAPKERCAEIQARAFKQYLKGDSEDVSYCIYQKMNQCYDNGIATHVFLTYDQDGIDDFFHPYNEQPCLDKK